MKKYVFTACLGCLLLISIPFANAQKEPQGHNPSGTISRGKLGIMTHVFATMGEYFAFDGLKYDVLSYQVVYASKAGKAQFYGVTGDKLSPELKAKFASAHTGDMIIFTDVKVKGPDGIKTLNGPTYSVI
jgi:hypothetical protein